MIIIMICILFPFLAHGLSCVKTALLGHLSFALSFRYGTWFFLGASAPQGAQLSIAFLFLCALVIARRPSGPTNHLPRSSFAPAMACDPFSERALQDGPVIICLYT